MTRREENNKIIDSMLEEAEGVNMNKRELEEELKKTSAGRVFLEEAEPCEDVVSRKEVMNQIFYSTDNSGDVVLGSNLRKRIKALPPATSTRKKGKWIRHEERKPLKYGYELIIKGKCSNCGEVFGETYKMNFCPNCGAEMESEE